MQPPLVAEVSMADEEYQAHLELPVEWSLHDCGLEPPSLPLYIVEEPSSPPRHRVK